MPEGSTNMPLRRNSYLPTMQQCLWVWGALSIFVGILQWRLWGEIPKDFSLLTRVFFGAGYVVFCGTLAAPTAIFCGICDRFFRRRFFWSAVFLLGSGTAIFAWADIAFYGIYGYHLDGMVLSMLTNPASGDSIVVGRKTIFNISLRVVAICATWGAILGAMALLRKFLRKSSRCGRRSWAYALSIVVAFISLFFFEKGLFLWSYLEHPAQTLRARALLGPLHIALPAKKLLREKPPQEASFSEAPETDEPDAVLKYPLHSLVFNNESKYGRPNLLFIVIESGHQSAMDPEVMPHLCELAQNGLTSRMHYSGGNCTRFGFFTLFYGIHPTYWHAALRSQTGPVLVKAAQTLGYRFRVASSTDLNFPEFRSTVFVDISPEFIFDKPQGEAWQRDIETTDRIIELIGEEKGSPFFGVAFLDSPHIPYRYPPQAEKFTPALPIEDVDVFTQGVDGDPETMREIRNRSFNALAHVDAQIGRIVQALKASGKWDNTAVIIAGDHGQEFCEMGAGKGHIGHNGAFTPKQTRTLFAAHLPGKGRQTIERITSHVDIAATLLPLMGVKNPAGDYTNGVSLLAENPFRPIVLMASWNEAVWTDGVYTVQIGRNTHNRGSVHVFDGNYREIGSVEAIPENFRAAIKSSTPERTRFLSPAPRP